MTRKINILPKHLANMIAAGEVVERPASVVKELLENALDAGASRIDVQIRRGGKELISVSDNGSGIYAEDLPAALTAHATSKISSAEDLEKILTMGFRGEALASVGAIAKVKIVSATADGEGAEISCAGGETSDVRPAASAVGTTLSVEDLFFNTPARRKFLRTDATEFGHIHEAITRIALGHLDIDILLNHNGKTVLNLPKTASMRRRIGDIFGSDTATQLIDIIPVGDEIKVTGLIGAPAFGRANTQMQYFFLNGRYIRDRSCQHALKEAYRGVMDPKRQPIAFIFIEMPPEGFDVNVHPTKTEVRFADGRAIHSHVYGAVKRTLQENEIRPAIHQGAGDGVDNSAQSTADDYSSSQRGKSVRNALADFFAGQPEPKQASMDFESGSRTSSVDSSSAAAENSGQSAASYSDGNFPQFPKPVMAPDTHSDLQVELESPAEKLQTEAQLSEITTDSSPVAAPADTGRAAQAVNSEKKVFQVHNSYIIAEEADGIVITDQHALHERIMYNRLLSRFTGGKLESQGLLLPVTVRLSPSQQAAMEKYGDLVEKLGIEVTPFGPGSFAINTFPVLLKKADPAEFLTELLDRAASEPNINAENLLESALAMMSCKAAIKAGEKLSVAEILALLADAENIEKATACPHGRPTQIRLTLDDLEKQFHRK